MLCIMCIDHRMYEDMSDWRCINVHIYSFIHVLSVPFPMPLTEMIIYHLFLFQPTFDCNIRYNNIGRLGKFIVYVAFIHVYFRRRKFSWCEKLVPENGVDSWCQFLERVS